MAEKKIARICWNTKGWCEPSGRAGKSTNSRAQECQVGYGHEEWLLDLDKLIDGYHYAYLQPIGASRERYVGNKYNISLFTIDSETKKRYWIGTIKDVEVTTKEQSRRAYDIYERNGWLREMEEQLESAGADADDFHGLDPDSFAVIRFRPRSLSLLDEPKEFSPKDPAVKATYYKLFNHEQSPRPLESSGSVFRAGHNAKKESTRRNRAGGSISVDLAHNRMQENIYKQLAKKHGKRNVGTERDNVDIKVQDSDGKLIFYELKTQSFIKSCLQEALGQLMIYAFYPNEKRAKKLVLVSPGTGTVPSEVKSFMKMLQKRFSIPIYYQAYNPETGLLDEDEY